MSVDVRITAVADQATPAGDRSEGIARPAAGRRTAPVPLSDDSRLAVELRSLVEGGDLDTARQRFEGLVVAHQRRALRIAYQYLRDTAEADEAVQDAFVKVFSHITSYREAWPFEVWFTRILINSCLDRRKARARRERWIVQSDDTSSGNSSLGDRRAFAAAANAPATQADPEARLLARE